MKTSEVFRKVKLHLTDKWTRDTPADRRYICMAVSKLYFNGMIGDRDRTRCRRLIMAHLGGKYSLEHWLWVNHNIGVLHTREHINKSIVTRKAWLDHLINHYEAKGD